MISSGHFISGMKWSIRLRIREGWCTNGQVALEISICYRRVVSLEVTMTRFIARQSRRYITNSVRTRGIGVFKRSQQAKKGLHNLVTGELPQQDEPTIFSYFGRKAIFYPSSPREVVFVRIALSDLILKVLNKMVTEITLSSCENNDTDNFSGRKLPN